MAARGRLLRAVVASRPFGDLTARGHSLCPNMVASAATKCVVRRVGSRARLFARLSSAGAKCEDDSKGRMYDFPFQLQDDLQRRGAAVARCVARRSAGHDEGTLAATHSGVQGSPGRGRPRRHPDDLPDGHADAASCRYAAANGLSYRYGDEVSPADARAWRSVLRSGWWCEPTCRRALHAE